ncbi:MAG TPA: prolyl oligopeptidase family serine peptidase [Bryobacteraceae bacterium]|nr:prolyl oligopeptidase family serine peptidase [Bryobacteraceae bacterium]
MLRRVILLAAVCTALRGADDWERQARVLRPADCRGQEGAMLDEIQERARRTLDAIRHARTAAEAGQSRPILRQKLEASLGIRRLQWPPDLQAQVVDVIHRRGYRIEKIVWQALPGVLVPAHLYLPEILTEPAPAVLFYVGHWWPDAKSRPDFQAFCINMARFGFVVLIWDPFGQGERGISARDHRRIESLPVGVSQQGIAEYETRCALEYLLSRKEVDPQRIGMTGASGGGYNTWITAALDDRIKVAVPVVGTSDFYEQISVTRPLDWYHAAEHCHFVAGLIRYANNHEFVSMVAPRPLLIIAASEDQSFPIGGVRRVAEYARSLYGAFGAAGNTGFFEDATAGHGYQQKKREAAYGWFLKWLMHRFDGGPYLEPPTEPAPFDDPELRCFPPNQNPPAGPGIVSAMRRLADHTATPAAVPVPGVTHRPVRLKDERLQRIEIPADKFAIPAFLLRPAGRQRGVVLAVDDRGKEATLSDPAIREALARGWAVLGIDPRGIGELATSKASWVAAVSLLLDDYFVQRQAADLLSAAGALRAQPLALVARGDNAALAASWALPGLPNLKWYVLRDGFLSYRQFIDRPESLEASFRLRPDTENRLTAFDREIPFFYVPFDGLRRADLPALLARARSKGLIVNPIDGDWKITPEAAARKLLPAAVRIVSAPDPASAEQAFVRSLN